MKNLANCKPSEFLRQTNKIRKAAEKWLTVTDIMNIRARMPELDKVTMDMPDEKKADLLNANRQKLKDQRLKNAMEILDVIMDKHPDETLGLLALMCFIEPEDADNHPVSEYLTAFAELIGDDAVIGFFTSLARWEQTDTSVR